MVEQTLFSQQFREYHDYTTVQFSFVSLPCWDVDPAIQSFNKNLRNLSYSLQQFHRFLHMIHTFNHNLHLVSITHSVCNDNLLPYQAPTTHQTSHHMLTVVLVVFFDIFPLYVVVSKYPVKISPTNTPNA